MSVRSIPLVSVIIPNYNHAHYLDERIKSILHQTYNKLELIILDDKSTDNSVEVINRFRGFPQVSAVIFNNQNSGSPFSQWKKGLSYCKGDIVWIAESDDSCDSNFLKNLVEFYISNNLCMAFSLSREMNANGELGKIVQEKVCKNMVYDGGWYIRHCLSMITNASSAIFSRECALAINNNYWEYKGAGDWLFWAGIASKGKVGVCASPLNYYRVHNNNTTSKLFLNGTDFFELRKIFESLYLSHLWPFGKYLKERIQMLYNIKYNYSFADENVRKRLLIAWGYAYFSILLWALKRSRYFC